MIDPRRYKNIFSRMGEILVKKNYITREQLNDALNYHELQDVKIGEALIELGFIDRKTFMKELAKQLNVDVLEENDIYDIDPDVVNVISKKTAERFSILPVRFDEDNNTLYIATEHPENIIERENIKKTLNVNIISLLANKETINKGIQHLYSEIQKVREIEDDSINGLDIKKEDEEEEDEITITEEESAPAIKFVNYVLIEALNQRATDVHIEPTKSSLKVRFRIDGRLKDIITPPKRLQAAIISRIKIISNIDIAEKRVPHDGRFSFSYKDSNVDIRVSTLPTSFGEKVVMRLLNKSEKLLNLNKLGISSKDLSVFLKNIKKPYGIILVSGPTGSGKTTTLYSILKEIITSEKNIVTVEDPIEYNINRVNQVQVNQRAGLSFAKGLRSILRQDPDIIMVGEIRDQETAEVAIRAALTGHLVLSTIHANDASTTVTRLIDMGIPPFLVGSSLIMVVAQRLVRKLCSNCKKEYVPDEALIEKYEIKKDDNIYKAIGCNRCHAGYQGRTGIFEILPIKKRVRKKIYRNEDAEDLRDFIRSKGITSMRKDGINKVKKGITSLEEVFSITLDED